MSNILISSDTPAIEDTHTLLASTSHPDERELSFITLTLRTVKPAGTLKCRLEPRESSTFRQDHLAHLRANQLQDYNRLDVLEQVGVFINPIVHYHSHLDIGISFLPGHSLPTSFDVCCPYLEKYVVRGPCQ